jgi:alkaline phosphatase
VTNGALNVLPDGRLLTPLYTLLGEKGWARGLVTTAEITHATPAGFAAATRSRDNAQSIALQYLERKIEVLLGGGKPFFDPAKRKDQRDLRGDFAKAGYAVVNDLTGLLAAPSDKFLLGTFADSHLPYTVDHLADPKLHSTMPTLAQMTRAALDRLDRHEQFMLQVEGARIDHAAHNSDAAGAIRDQMALDDALEVCLEYQAKNPDTLLVVTTDHGNSNLGLNGMGGGYRQSSRRFAALAEVKASYSEILKRLTKAGEKIKVPPIPNDAQDKMDVPDPMAKLVSSSGDKDENDEPKLTAAEQLVSALWVNPAIIQQIVGDATGYQMSQRRAMLFSRVLAGDYQALYDQMNSPVSQLGQLMANRLGIGWTGNTHTADYVPILAVGPGSERFAGFQENVDLFRHYTALAEVDYRNPSLPLIAANDHDGPEAHDVERPGRYAGLDVRMIG